MSFHLCLSNKSVNYFIFIFYVASSQSCLCFRCDFFLSLANPTAPLPSLHLRTLFSNLHTATFFFHLFSIQFLLLFHPAQNSPSVLQWFPCPAFACSPCSHNTHGLTQPPGLYLQSKFQSTLFVSVRRCNSRSVYRRIHRDPACVVWPGRHRIHIMLVLTLCEYFLREASGTCSWFNGKRVFRVQGVTYGFSLS